ncbi:MAG: DUF1549 and DUF1553 domain-containing protein [Limisphaerales bacterium]
MKCILIVLLIGMQAVVAAPVPPLSTAQQVRDHWAFQPVTNPVPPEVGPGWAQNAVDQFVLRRLTLANMEPAKRADRRTLIRRATMDLTGLMPTYAEVQQFVADDSPEAWPKLIDRLLASQHYGERWARHWLDVARYSDTRGYRFGGRDRIYPYAYTYRDYVVRAFNEGLPFDQFVIQQLAADHLELGEDKRPLAAMGFLALGRRFLDRQDEIIDDRIDVVTRGLMGFTVSCARCHDHKYDPIPTADYYSLHGVFNSSMEPAKLPLLGSRSLPKEHGAYQEARAKQEQAIEDFRSRTLAQKRRELRTRAVDYMIAVREAEEKKLSDGPFKQLLTARKLNHIVANNWRRKLGDWKTNNHPLFAAWHGANKKSHALIDLNAGDLLGQYRKLFTEATKRWEAALKQNPEATGLPDPQWESVRLVLYGPDSPAKVNDQLSPSNPNSLLFSVRNRLNQMNGQLSKLAADHPGAPPRAHVLVDKPNPVNPYIYIRGTAGNRGPAVPRQFLEHLAPDRKPFAAGSGRLELAKAIVHPDNPLTARVLVNRVWAHHFGKGLVLTPSDFGLRAQPPSHPELLDWLAHRFMQEGWSIKELHCWIMLSATYQQASDNRPAYVEIDPANRLLWKMNRQRISFEALRDTVLQASGDLDLKIGGRPEKIHTHPGSKRRTVYGYVDRQNLPALFRAFDFANPDAHCPKRYENIVPQQALFLMNSPFMIAQSEQMLKATAPHPLGQARVKLLYQKLFQRSPETDELVDALKYINGVSAEQREKAFMELAQVLFLSNEFRFQD